MYIYFNIYIFIVTCIIYSQQNVFILIEYEEKIPS